MGAAKATIRCCVCAAERQAGESKNGPRCPPGWKRLESRYHCGKCWGNLYILRAITLPVIGPVDCEWSELRELLRAAWSQTTAAANYITSELYARDVRRNGQDKCPPMPKVYLYPEIRARFPDLPSTIVPALEHDLTGKYRERRYKIIWTAEESLANVKYPYPYPVPASGVKLSYDDQQHRVICRCNIAGRQTTLALRGDTRFTRQVVAVKQIIDGEAIQGQISIYRARKDGAHNTGITMRENGAASKVAFRVMVKIVAWLPRKARVEREGTLYVRTDRDSLLVALNAEDERLWIYNGDHARRWVYEHQRHLNRWADDTKAEQRKPSRRRQKISDRREASAVKFRDRMNTLCHEVAASVVKLCVRRRLGTIQYTETAERFLDKFPYFQLRSLIEQKADAEGIRFVLASGDVGEKTQGPLADDVNGDTETCLETVATDKPSAR